MVEPPRGELPPDVEKAARNIHRAVWSEDYVKGRGPMHYAGGPYWPDELLRLADCWERMAVGARICSAHMTAPGPDDTHDWRDDDIVLGVGTERFCWNCGCLETSGMAGLACDHGHVDRNPLLSDA
jgi:hypothetical protein